MKNISKIILFGVVLGLAVTSYGRNTVANYSIKDALVPASIQQARLGNRVKFYFGNSSHPKVLKHLGKVSTNRKTNAFNKPDTEACQWVFLSALKSLRDQALRLGGNAVINIQSNYQNNLVSSKTKFACGAGALIAGAALIGEIVKLK